MELEIKSLRGEYLNAAKLYLAKNYLLQIGKNVGDTVTWSFTNYSGTSKNCYQGLKTCNAEIKQHDDGTIFIQSLDICKNGFTKWNGKYGRARSEYWAFEEIYPCVDLINISCLAFKI